MRILFIFVTNVIKSPIIKGLNQKTYFNNILESSNADIPNANYKRFYFDVKLIREKINDENLIIQTNVMLSKVEDYNKKIKIYKEFNNELIEILSQKDTH